MLSLPLAEDTAEYSSLSNRTQGPASNSSKIKPCSIEQGFKSILAGRLPHLIDKVVIFKLLGYSL